SVAAGNYPFTVTATSGTLNHTATAKLVLNAATDLKAVNHIVYMLQENRSFDTYFAQLNEYRAANNLPGDAVDEMPTPNPQDCTADNACNNANDGTGHGAPVPAYHIQTACIENEDPDWL